MPLPDRPFAHSPGESVWGQAVHDYTFAPAGCIVHGGAGTTCGTTITQLNLDAVDDDPGGYLDAPSDRIEVPTGGEGFYVMHITASSVNGSAGSGFQTQVRMYLNGVQAAHGVEDNAGGTTIVVPVTWIGELSAGDVIIVQGQRRGGGTNPTVQVQRLVMLRVGAEVGSP